MACSHDKKFEKAVRGSGDRAGSLTKRAGMAKRKKGGILYYFSHIQITYTQLVRRASDVRYSGE
ncbi:MAG: hypothetical protein DSY90_14760 [Deltaproteobacteria bacterium]|nr:MAG: hypothetical protein DSY90_14760 [Deltaproteobacteria bacterium]